MEAKQRGAKEIKRLCKLYQSPSDPIQSRDEVNEKLVLIYKDILNQPENYRQASSDFNSRSDFFWERGQEAPYYAETQKISRKNLDRDATQVQITNCFDHMKSESWRVWVPNRMHQNCMLPITLTLSCIFSELLPDSHFSTEDVVVNYLTDTERSSYCEIFIHFTFYLTDRQPIQAKLLLNTRLESGTCIIDSADFSYLSGGQQKVADAPLAERIEPYLIQKLDTLLTSWSKKTHTSTETPEEAASQPPTASLKGSL